MSFPPDMDAAELEYYSTVTTDRRPRQFAFDTTVLVDRRVRPAFADRRGGPAPFGYVGPDERASGRRTTDS